jgi:hypothetical protein
MRLLPLLALFLCAACGGGGGGSASAPAPALKLQISDAVVAPTDTLTSIDVTLASAPAGTALVQFDVVVDPTRLGPATGRASLEPLQTQPTYDGNDVGGGVFRVMVGDGRNQQAASLTTGPLVRIWLETRPPRTPGTVPVRIQAITASDGPGTRLLDVDGAPVGATVTLR